MQPASHRGSHTRTHSSQTQHTTSTAPHTHVPSQNQLCKLYTHHEYSSSPGASAKRHILVHTALFERPVDVTQGQPRAAHPNLLAMLLYLKTAGRNSKQRRKRAAVRLSSGTGTHRPLGGWLLESNHHTWCSVLQQSKREKQQQGRQKQHTLLKGRPSRKPSSHHYFHTRISSVHNQHHGAKWCEVVRSVCSGGTPYLALTCSCSLDLQCR